MKPTLSYTVSLRDLGFTLESFSNKMQNECLEEEQKEHQQSLEAEDKYKLQLLKDRKLAREKEQERRRREAVSEFYFTKSNNNKKFNKFVFYMFKDVLEVVFE